MVAFFPFMDGQVRCHMMPNLLPFASCLVSRAPDVLFAFAHAIMELDY